ncbi:hypothetical protein EGI11_01890 [Chryseobacterium sp. H3056]|uniref:Uncharacterized protein n=1 Tax=Kaistella daneshvariae TaxID=2487074 RepID=A0A3N0WZY1_9FLAO|nr:hypothetical protein EGI11_01890 [Kaistella daneshvariae]
MTFRLFLKKWLFSGEFFAIGIAVEILFCAAAKPPRKKDCNVEPDPSSWKSPGEGIAQINTTK